MTDQYTQAMKDSLRPSTLVVGLGGLGRRIAIEAQSLGGPVLGMRRQDKPIAGVDLLQHDATRPWPALPAGITDVVFCLSPQGSTDAGYDAAYTHPAAEGLVALQRWAPKAHVWLISSTSVYPQQNGEWITEAAPANPTRSTAGIIRQTEKFWLDSQQEATALRPAGIYGPGRTYLLRQAAEGFQVTDEQPVYTNRIHVEDAARAVVHLIAHRRAGRGAPPVVNLADQSPISMQALMAWLQEKLHVVPTTQRVLGRGSKRVSSELLAATGFNWRYPSYREGYQDMIAEWLAQQTDQ